jgi:aspartate kinase
MKNKGLCIFKFGGASVKSAQGVKNLAEIVRNQSNRLIVVVSAMDKTTNALERILSGYLENHGEFKEQYNQLKDYHIGIANELFSKDNGFVMEALQRIFGQMEDFLQEPPVNDYNFTYDQFVPFGEILSSTIISLYLKYVGVSNAWMDIRQSLISDCNYREGNIDLALSEDLCKKNFCFDKYKLFVTQGFIAGTREGTTTTLGREGSDYTAALLANLIDAESITIWKDVEGVLNADPKTFPNTVKLDEVSFKEAIELAYCGAQIIHPKTIKPLRNKQISLFVKSFLNPQANGTLVYQTDKRIPYPPILIQKTNQVLISLTPLDFSFVIEDCLSKIFSILYKHRVKANLVQSSAISFSICVDDEEHFLPGAIDELKLSFSVRYNKNLELLTIRHYTQDAIIRNTSSRLVYLQQLTRSTARFVMATFA